MPRVAPPLSTLTSRRRWLRCANAVALAFSASTTRATECGTTRPWVEGEITAAAWSSRMTQDAFGQLEASLADQRFDLCRERSAGAREAVARIQITVDASGTAAAITITDGITGKQLVRSVDFRHTPADARSISAAIAADELLRASWAELALRRSASQATPPEEVERVVERALSPEPTSTRSEFGARFAYDGYSGGQQHLGVDVVGRHWFTTPIGAELSLCMRAAPNVSSTHGEISESNVGLGAVALVRLIASEAYEMSAGAGAVVKQLRFRGEARAGFNERAPTELAVIARAGVTSSWALGESASLQASLLGGVPVRSVTVLDDTHAATGVSGVELHASLGVLTRL